MKFSEIVQIWGEVEKTPSRNEKTEMLSVMLKNTPVDEMTAVVNLSLGQLKPAWEGLEFSLAEKQVLKAVAQFFSKDLDEILTQYKKMGDIGELIGSLDQGAASSGQNVGRIYEELVALATISGPGSVELKLNLLGKLFGLTSSAERKFLCRIVLGKQRLGFSDQTLIDGLSLMMVGDKSLSKRIEKIYQATPDIGMVATNLKRSGESYLKKAVVVPGVPVMPMLCQRLKSPKEMIEKMGRVAVEAKFDGTRVQIHFDGQKVLTFTRNLEETSQMFPELGEMKKYVNAKSVVLDAEAVAVDKKTGKILPFQVTITRKRKHGIDEVSKEIPLRFYVFDVLEVSGETVMDKTYEQRRELLKKIILPGEVLVIDDYRKTEDPAEIESWHREYLDQGLEGVIVKKIDSEYIPGRTGWNWVKMKEVESSHAKLSDTIDAIVMGFYAGRGKRSQFGIGALLIGVRSGDNVLTLAKLGTGLSDELFREMYTRLTRLATKDMPAQYQINKNLVPDVVVVPELIVEVAADEITKSPIHTAGVALRFPRLIKIRDDKDINSATTLQEVEQIKQG